MMYRDKSLKLSSLCDVQSGYTARSKLEPATSGGVPAIQLRDLNGEDDFDPSGLPLYALGPSFGRYWAGPGDILFRSRGERNTAVSIASSAKGAAIAVLPLIVLHPNASVVDSRYLAWFINHPDTQRYFDKYARGTRLRMIPKHCLDDLEVPLPDLATQRMIVEIDSLARRERVLTEQLADMKVKLIGLTLLRQIQTSKRTAIHSTETIGGRPSRPPHSSH